MILRKALASAVIAVVLGIQLFMSVSGIGGSWFWPFQTYPMYASAHFATDSVFDFRLRARPCAPTGAQPLSLGAYDVGLTVYQLREELEVTGAAARATPIDTAGLAERATFFDALVARVPGKWCEVQIWERAYPNTGDVARALRSEWRLALRWPLGAGRNGGGWTRGDRIAPPAATVPSLPPLSATVGDGGRP